jgi:hypothetical protein
MLKSIADIKAQHEAAGSYWFEPATMRFFGTRFTTRIYPCASQRATFFVTSEQPPHGPRAYSVRKADWDGPIINTVGAFCGYSDAHASGIAARLAAGYEGVTVRKERATS